MKDTTPLQPSASRILSKARAFGLPACFLLAALSASGCKSIPGVGGPAETTLFVRCDAQVNNGVLLTLDFVQVNDAEFRQISSLGSEWFYDDLREQFRHRTRTISVSGNCDERIELREADKNVELLAIVADYQSDLSEGSESAVRFREERDWKGKKLTISVHNAYLEVNRGG